MRKSIYLAKLGICESTDENGNPQIQRIDSPEEFKEQLGLSFLPEKLESDEEAQAIFNGIPIHIFDYLTEN